MTSHVNTRSAEFNFGLSTGQESRAAKLHGESIVFDLVSMYAGSAIFRHYSKELQADLQDRITAAHSSEEILEETIFWPFEMSKLGKSDLLRDWFLAGGLTCGSYEIDLFIREVCRPLSCDWNTKPMRYAQLPWLRYVTTGAEIRQAKRDGVVALYANCQPVIPVPRDLTAFDVAYGKGLRSFMLTYNRMDNIGTGCTERVDAGLSMFGVEVIEHCNDIGMMIDVSHCGHLTTMDACRRSKGPVNANHTAARSVYAHARGKSNEALRAIADTGGVIGVLAVPHFLSGGASPTIVHMLDHIDYIADLVGWQHVAIGTDWPWPIPPAAHMAIPWAEHDKSVGFRAQDRVDRTRQLGGFQGCRDLPNITRGLVKRGYSDEQIQGILGQNALRVFEEVCG